MSVSQSVSNRLPVFSGHPPKTPPIELKSNQNTRGGQGKAAKIYSGRNSFKKKVENFCEKNVEKHVVKCMGIFTSPRGDPYENDQKSPKITKISEIREITGTWGFTSVLPGSTGFTWVDKGAHRFKLVQKGTLRCIWVHTGAKSSLGHSERSNDNKGKRSNI